MNTLNHELAKSVHWVAAKHVLCFLSGAVDFGLDYKRSKGIRLVGYTDSDWAGSVADWKNTSRCCFSLGSAAVLWFSQNKKSIALNTAKSEYMATSLASCEALWLCKLLVNLFGQELMPMIIYCDN